MAEITAALVKDLRDRTGAGFMDCKKALAENDGDMDKAIEWLKAKGVAKAAGKAGREAREGLIGQYIHAGGKLGVLIEVNSVTDFVARNDEFQKLVRDIAMQVAGMAPSYVTIDDIPAEELAAKKAELLADEATQNKPEEIRERIVEGHLSKCYKEVVLYEQTFRDTEMTVGDLVTEAVARIGENIRVRRFVRYQVGEAL